MPRDLVLVRHGQSEANVLQAQWKEGESPELPDWFEDRHDWQHPLSQEGREQARLAGQWILENIGDIAEFEGRFVSPYLRARQTAYEVGRHVVSFWSDDRIIERDWGVYGVTPRPELDRLFPETQRMKRQSAWYARLDGGESMNDIFYHVRDFFGTLHREYADKQVIAVTHGEKIWSTMYVVERLLPEAWQALEDEKSLRLTNGTVVHYTKINPEDPTDQRSKLSWRRISRPTEPETSPYGGQWVELPPREPLSPEYLNLGPEEVTAVATKALADRLAQYRTS
ncbi:MAG TPA: histidine phosphatase family protein [Candidatus Saccharimonadales bacterium]|nr:histidine phosphatase family protein [Candidatus Saccharimonadales bacterium]